MTSVLTKGSRNSFRGSVSSETPLCLLSCLLSSSSSPAESAEEEVPDAMFKESCITEQTQYFFDNDERSYAGVLDCGNCSR